MAGVGAIKAEKKQGAIYFMTIVSNSTDILSLICFIIIFIFFPALLDHEILYPSTRCLTWRNLAINLI